MELQEKKCMTALQHMKYSVVLKFRCTFASNGGGVNSFPLAINMAFIFAAMAAAISTPP